MSKEPKEATNKFFSPGRSLGNFAPLPDVVMKNPALSPGAKLCYARLLQYCGNKSYCWPKQSTLSKDTAIPLRRVQNLLYELRDNKFIKIINPKGSERLSHAPNKYYFLWHSSFGPITGDVGEFEPEDNSEDNSCERENTTQQQNSTATRLDTSSVTCLKENIRKKKTKEESPPSESFLSSLRSERKFSYGGQVNQMVDDAHADEIPSPIRCHSGLKQPHLPFPESSLISPCNTLPSTENLPQTKELNKDTDKKPLPVLSSENSSNNPSYPYPSPLRSLNKETQNSDMPHCPPQVLLSPSEPKPKRSSRYNFPTLEKKPPPEPKPLQVPGSVSDIIAYWENLGLKKLNPKTKAYRNAVTLIKKALTGKLPNTTQKYTRVQIIFAINNFALAALSGDYEPALAEMKNKLKHLNIDTFFCNPFAFKENNRCLFLQYISGPPKPISPELQLVEDKFPPVVMKMKKWYITTVLGGIAPQKFTLLQENHFRKASLRMVEFFQNHYNKFNPGMNGGMMDFVRVACDAIEDDARGKPQMIETGWLCSDRTFNKGIPAYLKAQAYLDACERDEE